MKKELTEEQLIELARKAKPVPVPIDGKKRGKPKKDISSVMNFIQDIGIEPGRNEVENKLLYNAYRAYCDHPVESSYFHTEMNKILKRSNKVFYKVNMKIITILEKVKELKNEQQENQNEVPWIKQES
jgi:hypothetical protein